MNIVILKGNLGQNPEIRTLESGVKVAKFSFATNESFKDKTTGEWHQHTDWHTCVAWRHLAERIEKYAKKGSTLIVQGKLTHRKYVKDDETRYYTEVVANKIELLDKRTEGGYFPNEERSSSEAENGSATPKDDLPDHEPSPADASSDEIPF